MKEREIEARLRKYLDRDKNGIRRALIETLLSGRKYTTDEIFRILNGREFELNIRGVSAMVGLIGARIGILKVEMGDKNRYYLKEEYRNLVKKVLEEYDSKNI